MSCLELISMTYFGNPHTDGRCSTSNSPDDLASSTSVPRSTPGVTYDSGLGTLAKLSPEIRCLVWQHLMPEHRSNRQTYLPLYLQWVSFDVELVRPLKTLSILQASQQLHEEVAGELYNNRALHFCIDPKYSGWTIEDLPEASARDFNYTNYANFKVIKIDIYPPDVKDPGQLLRARKNIIDLVATLARSTELQRIEIILFKNGSSTWYDHEIAQRSIDSFDETDLEQLLGPFRYLRKAKHAKIELPPHPNAGEYLMEFAEEVESRMMTSEPFGTKTHEEDFVDKNMDVTERTIAIRLDLALDTMKGSTAANLRRDRFNAWYDYTREKLRLVRGGNVLSHQELRQMGHILDGRYRAYLSWNPYSERMIKAKGYDSYDLEYFDLENQWEANYPGGIPLVGSPEWLRHMTRFPWDGKYSMIRDDEANPLFLSLEMYSEFEDFL